MATAYQYTADGYFAGEIDDYGLLPNNATRTAPTTVDGMVPYWTGKKWEQVENHRGESGYVNGVFTTIAEYGPLPSGWSTDAPEKTLAELLDSLRSARAVKLSSKYDPAISQLNRDSRLAATEAEQAAIAEKIALWDAWAVALCNLPTQDGAPWDGGGDATPWPAAPDME